VQFLLSSEASIKKITIRKEKEWIDIPYKINGKDSLLLSCAGIFEDSAKYPVRFEYSMPAGKFNDTMLMLDRGNRWYPLIMDQVASFKLYCEAPKGCAVLSAGNLISKKEGTKEVYIYESKTPVFKIPLLIYNPAKYKKVSNKIFDLYLLASNPVEGRELLGKIEKAFCYFSSAIGAYSYERLSIIEIPYFPGVNTGSGLIMAGMQSIEAAIKGDDDIINLSAALQWFGAGVFAKYGGKGFPFLTITLPNYLCLMFERSDKGEEFYENELKQILEKYKEIAGKENDIPLLDISAPNTREKGIILYAKGPYILSRIEKIAGAERWKNILRNLYEKYKGNILTYEEFEKHLARDEEQESVIPLFRKMMSEKGMPSK